MSRWRVSIRRRTCAMQSQRSNVDVRSILAELQNRQVNVKLGRGRTPACFSVEFDFASNVNKKRRASDLNWHNRRRVESYERVDKGSNTLLTEIASQRTASDELTAQDQTALSTETQWQQLRILTCIIEVPKISSRKSVEAVKSVPQERIFDKICEQGGFIDVSKISNQDRVLQRTVG